ncbi:MAG: hypothetical protein AB1673_16450 [Actinomycetota bacterium]
MTAVQFEPRLRPVGSYHLDEAVSTLAWSRTGRALAAGSYGGEVVMATGDGTRAERRPGAVVALGWSGRAGVLAAAYEGGAVLTWPLGGSPRTTSVEATADDLAWGPDGTLAVATSAGVVLLDRGGEVADRWPAAPGVATVVCWAGDRTRPVLLVGGIEGVVELEVPFVGAPGRTWTMAAVTALAADGAPGTVVAGTLGGDLEVVERGGPGAVTGRRVARGPVSVVACCSSPAPPQVAVVADGWLRCWRLGPPGSVPDGPRRLAGHDDWVVAAAFSPRGNLLASTGLDGNLVLWSPAATAEPLEIRKVGAELGPVAWGPQGASVAVGGPDGRVSVLSCERLLAGAGPG